MLTALTGSEIIATAIDVISAIIFGVWLFLWLEHTASIFIAKWKLHKVPVVPASDKPLPGISIVKPLAGMDSNLHLNIESFFNLEYPGQYELLFGARDAPDTAIAVIKSLMSKYSNIDARIFVDNVVVGVNPKINNMAQAISNAKYDLIYIADSGIKAKPDTLLDLLVAMRPSVGMVHQLPYIVDRDPPDIANTYHKVFFGTAHAKPYLFLNWIGMNCTTGMSSMIRRSIIERAGGLSHFGRYLAEDYFLSKVAMDQGWQVKMTSNVALQASGNQTVGALQQRQMRWIKLRNAMIPFLIVFEPLTECFVCCIIASAATSHLFGWSPFVFIPTHCSAWFILDYILLTSVNPTKLKFSTLDFLVCWIFREILALPLFIRALLNPVISWHGTSYVLKWGGFVEKLEMASTTQLSNSTSATLPPCQPYNGGLNILLLSQYGFR